MAGGVQNGRHDNDFLGFLNLVDHPLWKTVGITPADFLVRAPAAIEKRIFGQGVENSNHFLTKLFTQSFQL